MAKKTILYPIVKETTYHEECEWNDKQGLTGKPKEVAGTLISYSGYIGNNVELIENKVLEIHLHIQDMGEDALLPFFILKVAVENSIKCS